MSDTIAVVEDDADILELIQEILEIDDFQAVTFTSPDVEKIVRMTPQPAVILIDLMLPGMTGVELASRLRTSAYPDTPMIAMSASRLMLEVAYGSGSFHATIAKPFNLSTLLETVEDCLAMGSGTRAVAS